MVSTQDFDNLTRTLASGNISRRKALRLVGGMLGGALLASVPGLTLNQRSAEGAEDECPRAASCCQCVYGEFNSPLPAIVTRCFTKSFRKCGERSARFHEECVDICVGNRPTGLVVIDHEVATICNEEEDPAQRIRWVCRRSEFGPRCVQRRCNSA